MLPLQIVREVKAISSFISPPLPSRLPPLRPVTFFATKKTTPNLAVEIAPLESSPFFLILYRSRRRQRDVDKRFFTYKHVVFNNTTYGTNHSKWLRQFPIFFLMLGSGVGTLPVISPIRRKPRLPCRGRIKKIRAAGLGKTHTGHITVWVKTKIGGTKPTPCFAALADSLLCLCSCFFHI